MFLELNDIEHLRTKVRTPRTNSFIDRPTSRYWMSSFGSPSEKSIMKGWKLCRQIWMPGWSITIQKERIGAIATWAAPRSLLLKNSSKTKDKSLSRTKQQQMLSFSFRVRLPADSMFFFHANQPDPKRVYFRGGGWRWSGLNLGWRGSLGAFVTQIGSLFNDCYEYSLSQKHGLR